VPHRTKIARTTAISRRCGRVCGSTSMTTLLIRLRSLYRRRWLGCTALEAVLVGFSCLLCVLDAEKKTPLFCAGQVQTQPFLGTTSAVVPSFLSGATVRPLHTSICHSCSRVKPTGRQPTRFTLRKWRNQCSLISHLETLSVNKSCERGNP
jgi:hypothetical protein